MPGEALHGAQEIDRLRRKRDDVFLALLHALGGDAPDRRLKVELMPARAHDLARPA